MATESQADLARLRAEVARLQTYLFRETALRIAYEEDNKRLRRCLEQYANEKNWECGPPVHYVGSWDSKWIGDGYRPWDIAAAALRGEGGEQSQ